MNKKGFTLVELLGVITLLAIISLIAVPTITNLLGKNKDKAYTVQVENFKTSLNSFAGEHMFNIPEDSETIVSLYQLAKLGYTDVKVNNPKTDKNFALDTQFKITKTPDGYKYDIIDGTDAYVFSNDELDKIDDITLPDFYMFQTEANNVADFSTLVSAPTGVQITAVSSESNVAYDITFNNGVKAKAYINIYQ